MGSLGYQLNSPQQLSFYLRRRLGRSYAQPSEQVGKDETRGT